MSEASVITDAILGRQQQAQQLAVGGIGEDPEEAAAALRLSKTTGVPYPVVAADVEGFTNQSKATATAALVQSNPYISDYIDANLAAYKVSNDDYANLDSFSGVMKRLTIPYNPYQWGLSGSVLSKTFEGFKEGYGDWKLGQWIPEKFGREFYEKYPISTALWAAIGLPIEVPSKLIGGVIHGAAKGSEAWMLEMGIDPSTARSVSRDIGGLLEYATTKPPNMAGVPQAIQATRPYIEAGREPPPGIHPIIDQLKVEQSKLDMENFDAVFKEAQTSLTRERSPELFADFARQHTEARIGISADAVLELYKNKEPLPEDGILGWVPNIAEQLRVARESGGDIEVPIADWLAHADPKVAKEVHDFIRVRRDGLTIEEGKVTSMAFMVEAYHGSPHEFEAFKSEAIGTGQGAQTYGHGLYFAENRNVAESYKPQSIWNINGELVMGEGIGSFDNAATPNGVVAFALHSANGDRTKALKYVEEERKRAGADSVLDEAIQILKSGDIKEGSNLYRVAIHAEKEHFLDWDKPLSEQPQGVQDFAKQHGYPSPKPTVGDPFWDNMFSGVELGPPAGQNLYKGLVGKLGSRENVSKAMAEAGIPGIKYLDQGSRGRLRADIEKDIKAIEDLIALYKTPDGAELYERSVGEDIVKGMSRQQDKLAYLKRELSQAVEEPTYNYVIFDPSIVRILDRNGEAINAVRQQADLKPMFALSPEQGLTPHDMKIIEAMQANWREFTDEVRAMVPKRWTKKETEAIDAANAVLDRILPQKEKREVQPTRHISMADRMVQGRFEQVEGGYIEYSDRIPTIMFLAEPDKAVGLARHEAIHYLKRQGFFTKEEWQTLKDAAVKEKWLSKHQIAERYSGMDLGGMIEEAIAEQFRHWREKPETQTAIGKVFEKLQQLVEQVREAIRKILGPETSAEEIFTKIETGEIGSRVYNEPMDPGAFRAAKPGVPEQSLFAKANAIGMTNEQFKTYMTLIKLRALEDARQAEAKVLEIERKRQTREWKEAYKEVEAEAKAELSARPDIAAGTFFVEGRLFDKEFDKKPRLHPDYLTEEQIVALPKSWISKSTGLVPDDVAGLFGYHTGQALVDRLIEVNKNRGTLPFSEYVKDQVRQETEKRMLSRFGDLEENILREAKEHVVSETQMDLLHEETLALGMRAGVLDAAYEGGAIKKGDIKAWVQQHFSELKAQIVDLDKYLNEAGKAGRAAEIALLKTDFTEAFKQKQRQYLSMLLAKEAKAFERDMEKFERVAKRFSAREIKGIDQTYTDFIQALLSNAELPVRRNPQELRDALAHSGHTSLESFVATKTVEGWELAVADYIQAGEAKAFKDMSVTEARDFKAAIDSLVNAGRKEKRITVLGKEIEFDEFKQKVLENIRELPPRDKDKPRRLLFRADAELTKVEEMVKDLDARRPGGELFMAVIEPLAKAKSKEYAMLDKLSKELAEIKGFAKEWKKSLDDTIPNDFLHDPYTNSLFDLSRKDMIGIMLNFGNRSNIEKFTKGWGGKESARLEANLMDMFDRHATKEDWQYVQKMWDLFETWKGESDTMYRNLSGVPPKWIEAAPIMTRHGEFKGGYFPIIYDKLRSNATVIEDKAGASNMFGENYFRATTGAGYTKTRTGYVDYVQFNGTLEMVAGRMQQMIHDITHREAVMDVGKVIYDRQIRAAIRKHYGVEYEAQLHPWLKDVANHYNANERAVDFANSFLRTARFNLVAHALGFNLKVILSPNLGKLNPKDALSVLSDLDASIKLAHEKSAEIPHTLRNLDRDFREKLERTMEKGGWEGVQKQAMEWSFLPFVKIEQGFRVITFVSEYKRNIAKGMDEAEAVARADSVLRERHGTAGTMDLPAIMRSNEAMKTYTIFYGFFNTMYNWQRQLPGQLRRGEFKDAMGTLYGSVLIPAAFGMLLFNQGSKDDSWFKTIAKGLTIQPLSTIPFVREVSNYMLEGFPPRSPWESIVSAYRSAVADVEKYRKGKKVEKPISHVANVIGLTTGLPLGQIGRTAQFYTDVATGAQRPRNILEYMRGTIHGEARPKK